MYELEFLPIARQDMSDIAKYINKVLCNPIAAMNTIRRMVAAAEDLQVQPYSCPVYYPPRELPFEYRKLVVGNYIMFYRVDETKKLITVVRVIYAKRDYGSLLKPFEPSN